MGGQPTGVLPAQAAGRTNSGVDLPGNPDSHYAFSLEPAGGGGRRVISQSDQICDRGGGIGRRTRMGYAADDVRLATFAVVAFLDESILNSNNPIFADWPRMPLQEELFGLHTAGEMFFNCIDRLMAKSDSPQTADVLEIYALCLLLGYRGRYSLSGQESIRAIASTVSEKLQHLRGGPRPLAPNWAPPKDVVREKASDPWVTALLFGTLGALLLAVLFFVGFKFALISGASGLHTIAP